MYAKLYEETLQLLDALESKGCIERKNLMIQESSEDHI
jgi:hypothetical protein